MITSRYTFTFESPSGRFFIMNYLTGAIDEVEKSEVEELKNRLHTGNWDDYSSKDYLLERGYIFETVEDEEEYIREKYIEFLEEYENTPVQIIFSTTYACNFSCVYCFQESYKENSKIITPEVTDAFFSYIAAAFAGEKHKPYITLFGGEPLLSGEKYKKNLLYFLEKAKEYDYEITIVTNGYELSNYIPEFKRIGVRIKEIQVTMDGSPEQHNKRRLTASGKPTFDRIAQGVTEALRNGYRINLRMIVDKDNLPSLVKLAEFAEQAGWLKYEGILFETSIGRNYELHTCQPKSNLYDRVELWKDFLALAEQYPILKKFHKPHLHGIRHLAENGTLPMPVFDGCPAGKKEWAFDLYGNIYGCTASVGVEKYRLGNIFEKTELYRKPAGYSITQDEIDPEVRFLNPENKPEMYHKAIAIKDSMEEQRMKWQTRDVLTIPECQKCPVALSCGGGCGVLAANRTGEIHSPDCRPVKEIVAMAVDYYRIGMEEKEE